MSDTTFDNTNKGILFQNDRPCFQGKIDIDGNETPIMAVETPAGIQFFAELGLIHVNKSPKSDRSPNFMTVLRFPSGIKRFISAWKRQSQKTGADFFSLSAMEPKEEEPVKAEAKVHHIHPDLEDKF